MSLSAPDVNVFERARPRLEAIAYRLLGSASDAEDAVQETFLRWQAADRQHVTTPDAWLTKVLTNLCLNQLTSARARRETYVGMWLPEPLLAADRMLGPLDTVEQRESVSLAVLTLLERLTPTERVVYVLREAFGYPHGDIADILDISESHSQQTYHRAKHRVAEGRARTEVDATTARRIVEEFLAAAASGDTERLVQLLTVDVTSTGDGGGKVPARATPLTGALPVARFVRGLFTATPARLELIGGVPALYIQDVNGTVGVVVVVAGRVVGVICPQVTSEGIAALHIQVNPDKLARATHHWAVSPHGPPVLGEE